MHNLDDLKSRIEQIISEAKGIMSLLEKADPQKSLRAAKEIEATIERMKRQGLPVPEELKKLKLQLTMGHQENEEMSKLYVTFLNALRNLISYDTPSTDKNRRRRRVDSSKRKPAEYEKPLGTKGYSNLEDYLIPVIKLMWKGQDHKEAFRQIAKRLDVRYNTVSAQCTRTLGLTTDEFVAKVQSRTILDLIESKYSNQYQIIGSELKR